MGIFPRRRGAGGARLPLRVATIAPAIRALQAADARLSDGPERTPPRGGESHVDAPRSSTQATTGAAADLSRQDRPFCASPVLVPSAGLGRALSPSAGPSGSSPGCR